jgi:hypothetical protein
MSGILAGYSGHLMHRALLLALKPFYNAPLVKLAQTLKAYQRLTDLVVFHTDRAFLHGTILS